jgi:hypothetical protein
MATMEEKVVKVAANQSQSIGRRCPQKEEQMMRPAISHPHKDDPVSRLSAGHLLTRLKCVQSTASSNEEDGVFVIVVCWIDSEQVKGKSTFNFSSSTSGRPTSESVASPFSFSRPQPALISL